MCSSDLNSDFFGNVDIHDFNILNLGFLDVENLNVSGELYVHGNVSLNNTLYVTENGMVGIGTSNPTDKLSISVTGSGNSIKATRNNVLRSEEHTSELQSHSFISYAVFCLKKKTS